MYLYFKIDQLTVSESDISYKRMTTDLLVYEWVCETLVTYDVETSADKIRKRVLHPLFVDEMTNCAYGDCK